MPTPTTWSYTLIRLLFQFALKVFYGTIVIEGWENIPDNGKASVLCANHTNSLTDALLMVTSVPQRKRNMLRLTAKATQFGRRTFTSWLIENAGTLPLKRKKEDPNADNSHVMEKLVDALRIGDAVCLFPEGLSRFHPSMSPLKTGVARLVSDVLTKERDNPDYEIYIQNCSITYMHRQHWRSDVLVTFHPPMKFTPRDHPELLAPVDFANIRTVTANMHQQISSGTFDSPSWTLLRVSKLAARIYSPLGTEMTLGDHVRVVRTFLEAFKSVQDPNRIHEAATSDEEGQTEPDSAVAAEVERLLAELQWYQDQLSRWGVKDDRIRRPLPRRKILYRMTVRLSWSLLLFAISLPGLCLWVPVFATTFYAVHNFKKTGPIFDTWDEIAQYKLVYGFLSGMAVWFGTVLLTFPMALFTVWGVPLLMWLTLRWLEDAIASFRAFMSLLRLMRIGRPALKEMGEKRAVLYERIMKLAEIISLPLDPEQHYSEKGGGEKGRIQGKWDSKRRYFSVRRRRKRDWNETLRLYDQVDYPDDDLFPTI
ncbi:hypothetical protein CYLTODRAFT_385211 [Cylindrobasidium torrendii FP15055 ss-10]|uniref:Phospholipid/glycerol acyltransferase domain-containing protein n=1 Tax=Cylindrobasidium torrendii FP15055 ss-10 TaxID=1314674 RepID=A0A0D7BVD2_9AGAR|nr:hypothetical protein CYLTODRAFT_385211 [Cylindrobasidium torrendii FP15055 ss-10]